MVRSGPMCPLLAFIEYRGYLEHINSLYSQNPCMWEENESAIGTDHRIQTACIKSTADLPTCSPHDVYWHFEIFHKTKPRRKFEVGFSHHQTSLKWIFKSILGIHIIYTVEKPTFHDHFALRTDYENSLINAALNCS